MSKPNLDEQTQRSFNEVLSQFIEAWRQLDPSFVAYVEKYGGI